jgi:hypothetical protein
MIKPRSQPGPRRQNIALKTLGENPQTTQDRVSAEPAGRNDQPNRFIGNGGSARRR